MWPWDSHDETMGRQSSRSHPRMYVRGPPPSALFCVRASEHGRHRDAAVADDDECNAAGECQKPNNLRYWRTLLYMPFFQIIALGRTFFQSDHIDIRISFQTISQFQSVWIITVNPQKLQLFYSLANLTNSLQNQNQKHSH